MPALVRKSPIHVAGAALAVVLATACTGSNGASANESSGPQPADVAVAKARSGSLHQAWKFLGEARSTAAAELAAGASGEVLRIDVREGDHVERGKVLVVVDPKMAHAQVQAAQASQALGEEEAEQAVRDAERAERAGRRLMPESEIEQAVSRAQAQQARKQQLEAQLHEARARLSRHHVVAPFRGVVTARHIDVGDWVNPGDPVLDVVSDRQIEVLARVTPKLERYVTKGYPATLHDGEHATEAHIEGIVPALDPQTRTITLRLLPDTPVRWLRPGSTVDVSLQVEREDPGVIVPRDALVRSAVDTRVVKVVKGKAQPIRVEVVVTSAEEAIVRGEGLAAGDTLVVRGNERLRPKQPVHVVEAR